MPVSAIAVSRKARALMRENLWLAVIYNALAVPIAIAGVVTPLIAAATVSGSSVLVMLNALRAHPWEGCGLMEVLVLLVPSRMAPLG
jgi:P-type Cu2+ transporter